MTNRPAWRNRDPRGREPGANAKFYGYQSRFGDGNPKRRYCAAKTRAGSPCKNDCLQGSTRCRVHGGHALAMRSAVRKFGPRVISLAAGRNIPRKALAMLGSTQAYPKDIPWHPSPIMRGRVIMAEHNRTMDPKGWVEIRKELTEQILTPPRSPPRRR